MKSPALLLALALPLATVGCDSDDSSKAETTTTTTTTTTSEVTSPEVTVTGQWARNSPMVAGNAAAYMKLTSNQADALVGASVDPSIAEKVELHETKAVTSSSAAMGSGASSSAMSSSSSSISSDAPATLTMVPVDSIALPAGETVELKPGGLHVMMINLPTALVTGTTFDLTLDFENAPDQTIKVAVSTDAP
ncbi:MAG: copper chaperone PCu(A)C [Acidimicrobiia bacterium]